MGSSIPWPLTRPYQQEQTPPATASLPLEDQSLLEAMLPFYMPPRRGSGGELQLQPPQQQTPSGLASFNPTDLSNLVSPIEPTSSPYDVFETLRSTVPQQTEQRAVSADPPRWDMSGDPYDWIRPVSAPPSKPAAPTPTPPDATAPLPLPTPTIEPDHQDLLAGFSLTPGGGDGVGSTPAAWLEQPAKPTLDLGFTLQPNDLGDFDMSKWAAQFPDMLNSWILSPTSQLPPPYTYGYSPHAQPEPSTALLPTSGPSGSSPFPSFQDTYTPHDSPYDSTGDLTAPGLAPAGAPVDLARYI